jgi:hypothetical protein
MPENGNSAVENAGLVPLEHARDRLIRTWLLGVGVPMLILVIQSVTGKYDEAAKDVWSWFVPLVFPTVGLMVGVVGGTALDQGESRQVKKSYYEFVLWLSVGYLSILSLTILLEPFSPRGGLELYRLSNYWLAPLQGLVGGGIGYLFTSHRPTAPKPKRPAKKP